MQRLRLPDRLRAVGLGRVGWLLHRLVRPLGPLHGTTVATEPASPSAFTPVASVPAAAAARFPLTSTYSTATYSSTARASTAPAAPRRCPVIDFVELTLIFFE